ncbi:MAG: DNA polymerase IV [Candidatus Micrarchaeota archaeon]|nr:DNA polymerase IV [Candidatus Micrarchaeota archaeon]MDE1804732.1 DNA polymerase IV [Candidatus Micrarchaeota archaeon]
MKIIMLIDMDYFFAACEELRHPELREKPVVVGADPKGGKGRGVVSTCNYLARRYGIHSAMPISMAYRLKPDAVFLPVDYEYYEEMSRKVMQRVKEFATRFEQVSVDEAFIDVSGKVDGYDSALSYAKELKESVTKSYGLPCSVGVSTNRVLAKMACEAGKPDGIRLVKEEDGAKFLAKMPVGKLYGVGKKTGEKLQGMGYKSIGDLARANPVNLVSEFGSYGAEIYRSANGKGDDSVVENYEVKSIGRERTFQEDTSDRDEIRRQIISICKEIKTEIEKQGFSFKTITLKIRYPDFTEQLRGKSLGHYSNDISQVEDVAIRLFERYVEHGERIRKIGVRISSLSKKGGQMRMSDFAN